LVELARENGEGRCGSYTAEERDSDPVLGRAFGLAAVAAHCVRHEQNQQEETGLIMP
jgi:hypothetical protein